jgi:hypothetical protein
MLAALAPLLGVAGQFQPTDTDCMSWQPARCFAGECPLLSPTPLVVGHQICSAMNGTAGGDSGGVQGMLICTDPQGTQVGHANVFSQLGFDSQCSATGAECWVRDPGSAGTGQQIDEFFVANEHKLNLTWTLFHAAEPAPTNAYRVGGMLLGRTTGAASNEWGDKGNIIPGWVALDGNTLGTMAYEDYGSNTVSTYMLATCHPPTHDAYRCDNSTHLCTAVPPGSPGSFHTQQTCAASCRAPPPPPPGPPPPPPTYTRPYLRFAMAVPVGVKVDCTVSQRGISHTWSGYAYGRFSNWTTQFEAGSAMVTLAAAGGGAPLLSVSVELTPGPLVLALRADNSKGLGHYWPPTKRSLEPIAASYVPSAAHTAGVRLFNLSPDTSFAGMKSSQVATALATNVPYSLGSDHWAQIEPGQVSLAAFDALSQKVLGAVDAEPPLSPSASTLFLLGTQGDPAYATRVVLVEDAPLQEGMRYEASANGGRSKAGTIT